MASKAAVAMAILASVDGARKGIRKHQSQCGVAGQSLFSGPNASIVNGEDAAECAWTWQVGLKSSATGNPWCGGMLISPEWVLTAAHCVDQERQNGMYIVAGEWNVRSTSGKEQVVRSEMYAKHNRYSSYSMDFDIALIKLEKPMEMNSCVGTVCLPTEGSDVAGGTNCWITGWGTLASGGKQPDVLQEAQVQVLSNEDCRNTGYRSSQITDSMICAQGKTRSGQITDACQGDSGGPLVCESSGTWTVYGATSWGRGCAGANYPGIWARVHESLDWIDAIMSGQEPPAPPAECPFYCGMRLCLLDACVENCDFCQDDTLVAGESMLASSGCKSQADQDTIARKRSSLSDDVRSVVISCIGQSQSCVTRKVADMGFSSSCANCVGTMGTCAKDNCKFTCTWNGFKSEACKSCTVDYCYDALVSCTGLPRSQLPDP